MSTEGRILVTGPRDYKDYATVARAIALTISELTDKYSRFVIVFGDASGADALAQQFVNISEDSFRGRGIEIRYERHRADWDTYGNSAGPLRNAKMVKLGADRCLFFQGPCTRLWCRKPRPHNSHGATGCAKLAEEAGIKVVPF